MHLKTNSMPNLSHWPAFFTGKNRGAEITFRFHADTRRYACIFFHTEVHVYKVSCVRETEEYVPLTLIFKITRHVCALLLLLHAFKE